MFWQCSVQVIKGADGGGGNHRIGYYIVLRGITILAQISSLTISYCHKLLKHRQRCYMIATEPRMKKLVDALQDHPSLTGKGIQIKNITILQGF